MLYVHHIWIPAKKVVDNELYIIVNKGTSAS